MRFTAATVAFFVGLAAAMPNAADTTVYQTEEVTITSCGPEVTNCPGRTHSTQPSGASATETSTPAVLTTTPASAPKPSSSAPAPVVSSATNVIPAPPAVTSVIPHTSCTTWYETVTAPGGSSPTNSSPVGGGVPHVPSSKTGVPSGTASVIPSSTPVFNGAGAVSGSLTFAGAAAAAAFFLA
ncbi:uncharacterized protein N7498_001118 [Penicillium cinerascens]|uniref:GPI anchored serine-rich protein n=1 Tax=Penicillium cinerascens TaxID=70096 RepID=A0A9W9TE22_9EURO|nr:uncharacterized protein N7498_001118 [Penicillium cinerascens]KAJ5219019.1 hypothetical protein N7498_001118 [Penicillium cinerascens]